MQDDKKRVFPGQCHGDALFDAARMGVKKAVHSYTLMEKYGIVELYLLMHFPLEDAEAR